MTDRQVVKGGQQLALRQVAGHPEDNHDTGRRHPLQGQTGPQRVGQLLHPLLGLHQGHRGLELCLGDVAVAGRGANDGGGVGHWRSF
jgi:hypothetical protein